MSIENEQLSTHEDLRLRLRENFAGRIVQKDLT